MPAASFMLRVGGNVPLGKTEDISLVRKGRLDVLYIPVWHDGSYAENSQQQITLPLKLIYHTDSSK